MTVITCVWCHKILVYKKELTNICEVDRENTMIETVLFFKTFFFTTWNLCATKSRVNKILVMCVYTIYLYCLGGVFKEHTYP